MKRVFISSTSIDLKEYRSQVRKTVENFGLLPEMMEEFPAMDVDAVKGCMDAVDRCDLFIGIYAHRYGYCPAGSDISITEMEFNRATEQKMPRFCFFVEEGCVWKPEVVEDEPGKSKLGAFKRRMDASLMRNTFTTSEDLSDKVWKSLRRYFDTVHKPFTAPSLDPYRNLSGIEQHLPMIGRDDMLDEIKRRLLTGETLAVWGAGGMGKTRLAQAVAHDSDAIAHFDGILWAKLGLTPDTLGVLGEWAHELGISYETERLTDAQARVNVIQRAIGKRRMLLILDDAWSEEAALLLRLNESNCVRLLTTRQPVIADAFAGSNIVKLEELDTAACLELISKIAPEAVKVDRAGVEQIVEKMGRLPLGLKIIGGVLRREETMRSTSRIQNKIRELLESVEMRLLRLQDVIEIGVEELDEEARQALYALSVFPPKPNSFSEEAALAVTGTSPAVLYRFFDAGLLETAGGDRYMLHQTISDHAVLHLQESQRTHAFVRAVNYYRNVCAEETLDPSFFNVELENLTSVIRNTTWNETAYEIVALLDGEQSYLRKYGLYRRIVELRTFFRQQLSEDSKSAENLAKLGYALAVTGNTEDAVALLEEALVPLQSIDDINAKQQIYGELGVIYDDHLQDCEKALEYAHESLKLARLLSDSKREARWLGNVGSALYQMRKYSKAHIFLEEALTKARVMKDQLWESILLAESGHPYFYLGQPKRALEDFYEPALKLSRQIGHQDRIGYRIGNIAQALIDLGRYEEAVDKFEECNEMLVKIGLLSIRNRFLIFKSQPLIVLGRYEDALRCLTVEQTELFSGSKMMHQRSLYIAEIYMGKRDLESAIASIKTAERAYYERDAFQLQLLKGVINLLIGNIQQARTSVETCLDQISSLLSIEGVEPDRLTTFSKALATVCLAIIKQEATATNEAYRVYEMALQFSSARGILEKEIWYLNLLEEVDTAGVVASIRKLLIDTNGQTN